jgi:hypothetical protein
VGKSFALWNRHCAAIAGLSKGDFLMRLLTFTLLASTAVFLFNGSAIAETVTTKTVVQQSIMPDTNKINFMAFDLNNDGILSRREVGEKLFTLFDLDGNGSIDNIEFDKKTVMTIIPMEKTTLTVVDFDDDGRADQAGSTYEDFIKESHLMRFDDNKDGLSPAEFINSGYEKLDDDEDKLISLEEWKEAYRVSLHTPVDEPERYN